MTLISTCMSGTEGLEEATPLKVPFSTLPSHHSREPQHESSRHAECHDEVRDHVIG